MPHFNASLCQAARCILFVMLVFALFTPCKTTAQVQTADVITTGVPIRRFTDSTSCVGEYISAGSTCMVYGAVPSVALPIGLTVIINSTKEPFGAFELGMRPFGIGIDCNDPAGPTFRVFSVSEVGVCQFKSDANPFLFSNITIAPGTSSGDYCVSSPPEYDISIMFSCPPTKSPTSKPTGSPMISPTFKPSRSPTISPTFMPSPSPTSIPTKSPSSSPSSTPTTSPVVPYCIPQFKLKRKACQKRIKQCNGRNVKMKWTGPGCKIGGKKMGDGGCQCKGYCGYQCVKACKKDKECKWEAGVCKTKSGVIGQPREQC